MSIAVTVPLMFRKRGGRKLVVTPDGAPWAPRPRVDNAMVKALARAFRWRKMLDEGVCGTIEELAKAGAGRPCYMSRVLRLTLLAPDIVEAILDGRQPEGMQLEDLLDGFRWSGRQRRSGGESHEPRRPDAGLAFRVAPPQLGTAEQTVITFPSAKRCQLAGLGSGGLYLVHGSASRLTP